MQLSQRTLRRINIFSRDTKASGYVGRKPDPKPLGFVYAQVFPNKETLAEKREGLKKESGTTLILRREAGVSCGDLAGIFGSTPDSRVTEVRRYPDHTTVRTERI